MATKTDKLDLPLLDEITSNQADFVSSYNEAMGKIDEHDHTTGKGRAVPFSGLFSDSDLDFRNNDLLNAKSVTFRSSPASSLINSSVFVKDGELYFRDQSGTEVQITSGGRLTTQVSPVVQTTNLLYGITTRESTLSDNRALAIASATASFNVQGNRNNRVADSITSGSYVSFTAPSPTGYYRPWIGIRLADVGSLLKFYNAEDFDDIDDFIVVAPSTRIDGADYRFFVKQVPLSQSQTLSLVVRSYR